MQPASLKVVLYPLYSVRFLMNGEGRRSMIFSIDSLLKRNSFKLARMGIIERLNVKLLFEIYCSPIASRIICPSVCLHPLHIYLSLASHRRMGEKGEHTRRKSRGWNWLASLGKDLDDSRQYCWGPFWSVTICVARSWHIVKGTSFKVVPTPCRFKYLFRSNGWTVWPKQVLETVLEDKPRGHTRVTRFICKTTKIAPLP